MRNVRRILEKRRREREERERKKKACEDSFNYFLFFCFYLYILLFNCLSILQNNFTTGIAPCLSRIVFKNTTQINTMEDASLQQIPSGTLLPSGKLQRNAIERLRKEREKEFNESKNEEDGSSDSDSNDSNDSNDSDDDDENDYDDLTATENYNNVLKQLDQQAKRAWGVDLVVNPSEIKSFDAGKHPYFGAELTLRRSMRKSLRQQEEEEVVPPEEVVSKDLSSSTKSQIRKKIEARQRRVILTGKKASEAARKIKAKLHSYVEKGKNKKAKRLKLQDKATPKRRKPRIRNRGGNHIV